MKIFELISYKTCYYYLKDTSNLDLSDYIYKGDGLDEILEDYDENDAGHLYDAFSNSIYGENKDIIEIKTNQGSIIFHKGDDHNYIKRFLETNSQNAPCAFFASFRTSDDYIYAYAKEGKIERFMCNSEEGCYLEGEKTQAEIECNLNYSLDDEYSFITPYVNEDAIVNLASKIIPFDMEGDVEVVEINYYVRKKKLDDKTIPTNIDENIVDNIHLNLKKNNDNVAGISIYKKDDNNVLYIMSLLTNRDSIVYSDIVNSRKKDDIIDSLSRCLNVLAHEKYTNNPSHTSTVDDILNEINNNKMKQVVITTNIKYPNTISVSKINNHSFCPKMLQSLFNIKIFKNFKNEDLVKVYNYCIKKLK